MKKEEYVYKVFESVADGYDAANSRISMGQHLRWKRTAVGQLLRTMPTNGRVLDLCCGTGDMIQLLLEARPDLELTGLDFSPAMLAQAERRFENNTKIQLIQGNALALPFADNSFDGAIISFALRNTADYQAVLNELSRVAKSGAPVCCIDSFRPVSPLVQPFYDIYFSLMMPLLGSIKKLSEYRWLCRSTKEFLSPDELCRMMELCSLKWPEKRSFMLGCCVSICAYKDMEAQR